jgi:hypothetical protein
MYLRFKAGSVKIEKLIVRGNTGNFTNAQACFDSQRDRNSKRSSPVRHPAQLLRIGSC